MTASVLSDFQVVDIPLSGLRPSEYNPRKTVDAGAIEQLAASIRTHGINVPLIVREVEAFDEFEIVAGCRRYRAADAVGVTHVPCIVRELTDAEARELSIVDNLQREDVPPLEEAAAYAELLGSLLTVQAIAAQVGKPIEYVTRRLKLRSLTLHSSDAMRLQLITLDHALLLAKLGEREQDQALRYVIDKNATQKQKTEDLLAEAAKIRREGGWRGYWEPQSPLELKSFIERELKLQLSRAPWDLADAGLVPEAGACTTCPKNTGAHEALFGDLAITAATCTDAICFNAKRDAFVQLHVDAANAAGGAVRVSWKPTSVKPKWLKDGSGPDISRVLKYGQWIDVSGTKCEHMVTGVTVDFDEQLGYGEPDKKKKPGKVLKVCIAAGCKVHRKAWEKAAAHTPSKSGAGGGRDWEAERIAARKKQTDYIASELPIRRAVFAAIVASNRIGHLDLYRTALANVLVGFDHGVDFTELAGRHGIKGNSWELERKLAEHVSELRADELDAFALEMLSEHFIQPTEHMYERVKDDRLQLWGLAKKCGVDADAIAKRLSVPVSNSSSKEVAEKRTEQAGGARKKSPSAAKPKAVKKKLAPKKPAKPVKAAAKKSGKAGKAAKP